MNNQKICFQIKNKIIKDINDFNKKKRNPGIDFVRLISMYFIILNHILFKGDAFKKYNKYKIQLTNLHIFTDWHNNGFALISGIVGYKTNKYSNLLYLWFTVFFYSVGIHLFIKNFKKKYIINDNISIELFPIIFKRYWYFTAYFGMYLFLPVINKGIACLSKYEFKLVIISTLGIFVFWRDFKNPDNDVFNLNSGNSMIWLLIYYLTGAYIGKYRIDFFRFKKYIFLLLYLFIFIFCSYLYIKMNNNNINSENLNSNKELIFTLRKMLTKRFDSILKITQSIVVSLFFLQIHYNKNIAKIICFLGPLVFGVYLIHTHPIIKYNLLRNIFNNEPNNISLNSTIILILFKSLKMFIICIFIDYLRNQLFLICKIRKLCIFLETRINDLFN